MIENYKGWNISLTWNDEYCPKKNSDINTSFNQREKWMGVNINGNSIYGASLKEIRHIIDYPCLHK